MNVFVGFEAGRSAADSVAYSVAIGAYAGKNTAVNTNIAIGYQAAQTHTTGGKNIAIGYGVMNDTDAGSNSLNSDDKLSCSSPVNLPSLSSRIDLAWSGESL